MTLINIKNLKASVNVDDDKVDILKGVNLTIPSGEVHVIMGPNGSGKSTLSYVLAGSNRYTVTSGTVTFKGQDLLNMTPEERVDLGLFLSFQSPIELEGVNNALFLRTAVNAVRKARGQEELDAISFLKLVKQKMKNLDIPAEMLKRSVNVGFSGGEKKRNEVLQMSLLEPSFAILDETDSGLDIDALKIVADGINALRNNNFSALLITHHKKLLDHIHPDKIHVLVNGKIIYTGGIEVADQLEREGYKSFLKEVDKNG